MSSHAARAQRAPTHITCDPPVIVTCVRFECAVHAVVWLECAVCTIL